MVAKYLHKVHSHVTILLVLLVFVVAACGPNSAPTDSGAADAPVAAGEDSAASESDSTAQEEHAAEDEHHAVNEEEESAQHDADDDADTDSSAGGMMGGDDDAMHDMMNDDEAMGHDEAMEHDESMGHMEGGGHEDMAAAHNVPEEYSTMANPVEATDSSIARGAELFQATCAVCHGETGQGDGVGAAGLDPKPANLSDDHVQGNPDGALFYTISKGVPGTAMVAWESQISEEDRWNLVNFVRTIKPQ